MMTRPALVCLGTFNKEPSAKNASSLVGIPALQEVLQLHSEPYDEDLLGLCRWLHLMGQNVMTRLFHGINIGTMETIPEDSLVEQDWRKVSGFLV